MSKSFNKLFGKKSPEPGVEYEVRKVWSEDGPEVPNLVYGTFKLKSDAVKKAEKDLAVYVENKWPFAYLKPTYKKFNNRNGSEVSFCVFFSNGKLFCEFAVFKVSDKN